MLKSSAASPIRFLRLRQQETSSKLLRTAKHWNSLAHFLLAFQLHDAFIDVPQSRIERKLNIAECNGVISDTSRR